MNNERVRPDEFRKALYPYAVKCYCLSLSRIEKEDAHTVVQTLHTAIRKLYTAFKNDYDNTGILLFFLDQSIDIIQAKINSGLNMNLNDIVDFIIIATREFLAGDVDN